MFSSQEFRLRLEGLSAEGEKLYSREFESDRFGIFEFRISASVGGKKIARLQVFETSYRPGLELHLGSYLPFEIREPKKLIISDFDKTLVDTRYSTLIELWQSLRRPIEYFPTVDKSLSIFRRHVSKGFQPFILSASPHFYEHAIRDWLYSNKIYAGNIFLKDYRSIFSFAEGVLTTKDLKAQPFYKLNQLVTILSMSGVPEELALVGDSFESDEFIYLTLASVLVSRQDPWQVWDKVKTDKSFRLTAKQNAHFLSKFYQIGEMARRRAPSKLKIFIRCTEQNLEDAKARTHPFEFVQRHKDLVEYFVA